MAEGGGGFEIAQAHLTITAQGDDSSVEQATTSMGSRLTRWAAGLGLGALLSKGLADNLDMSNANVKLKAQLGLTSTEASAAGKVAGQVYRDNFGGSIDDVNESLKAVGNNMGDLSSFTQGELKQMSESALGLSSTFDVDVNDSTKAAAQLMKNGLAKNSQDAFDIITKGMQMGLNSSDDFLDTLNEYSPQFSKLGIQGPQVLGLISQGLKGGARDTDSIADAFKEFSLRAIDGSTTTAQGFKLIGLNAKDTAEAIAKGGPAAEQATDKTIKALQAIKDPVKQNTAGVALFGTQWEDTLRKALPGINLTKAATTDAAGATKQMNDDMGSTPTAKIESLKREMQGLLMQVTSMPGPLGEVGATFAALGPAGITAVAGITTIATNMSGLIAPIGAAITASASWIGTQVAVAATNVGTMAVTVATTVAGWATQVATAVASSIAIAAAWVVAYAPIILITAAVIGLVALIVMNWGTIKDVTVQLWNDVWNFTKAIWDTIMNGIKAALDFVLYLFLNWTIYGQVIQHWRDILNFITATLSAIKSGVSAALNWINSTAHSIMGSVAGTFSGAWSTVKGVFSSAGSAIKSTVSSAMSGVINAVTSKVSSMSSAAGRIKSAATGALKNLGSTLYSSGQALIDGFISGMLSKIKDVGNAASSLVGKAKNYFPWSPAKEGPLSGDGYTDVSGAKLVTDFAGGMLSAAPVVAKAADATMGQVATGMSSTVAVSGAPAPSGAGAAVNLIVNWSSFFVPTKEQLRDLFAQVAPDLNEALRKYNKMRVGVATT